MPGFQILEYQFVLVLYSPGSLHVYSGAIEKDICTNTVCVFKWISVV